MQRAEFLREINLMKTIGHHHHVVSMIGCCTLSEPVSLLVEHLPYGDLLHFLRNYRHQYQNQQNQHKSQLPLFSEESQVINIHPFTI